MYICCVCGARVKDGLRQFPFTRVPSSFFSFFPLWGGYSVATSAPSGLSPGGFSNINKTQIHGCARPRIFRNGIRGAGYEVISFFLFCLLIFGVAFGKRARNSHPTTGLKFTSNIGPEIRHPTSGALVYIQHRARNSHPTTARNSHPTSGSKFTSNIGPKFHPTSGSEIHIQHRASKFTSNIGLEIRILEKSSLGKKCE